MYKAKKSFEVPGYPKFEKEKKYNLPDDLGGELQKRGLVEKVKADKKVEKIEEKKDEKFNKKSNK